MSVTYRATGASLCRRVLVHCLSVLCPCGSFVGVAKAEGGHTGIEPRAFRMQSECDTTTPCALVTSKQLQHCLCTVRAWEQGGPPRK